MKGGHALSERGGQSLQALQRLRQTAEIARVLAQKIHNVRAAADARIELGITARGVRPQLDQILRVMEQLQRFAQLLNLSDLRGGCDL